MLKLILEIFEIDNNPLSRDVNIKGLSPREIIELCVEKSDVSEEIKAIEKVIQKRRNIHSKWQFECGRKNPNLEKLKNLFEDLMIYIYGEMLNKKKLNQYLETVTYRQLCKEFAVHYDDITKLYKYCHNDENLLGEKWITQPPLDVILLNDNRQTYCFTIQELSKLEAKNDSKNPYTNNIIPKEVFEHAKLIKKISNRSKFLIPDRIVERKEREEKYDPIVSLGSRIDEILGTSHNGSVIIEDINSSPLDSLISRTNRIKREIERQADDEGVRFDMCELDYRLLMENKTKQNYAKWVLCILNTNIESVSTMFAHYLTSMEEE